MSYQCLITGVILIDEIGHMCIRGDLYQVGDCYVVNTAGCSWMTMDKDSIHNAKWITAGKFLEKNSVIVMEIHNTMFSTEAVSYMQNA